MEYLQYLSFFHLLEFIVASAGTFYIYKKRPAKKHVKYLVYFLWLTLLVEILGIYTAYAYYSDYEKLSFIENTSFERNFWMYNIKNIIGYVVYINFIKEYLFNKNFMKFLNWCMLFFFITAILNLIFSDVFFKAHSSYIAMLGSILIIVSVVRYYFEVLKSDAILNFKYSLVFYISIGLLFFELTVTPLKIYSKYFHEDLSPEFVALWVPILSIAIIFMYTCFTIGFLICSQKKNSYS